MSRGDRDHWDEHHGRMRGAAAERPAAFVEEHAALLHAGRTLDLAAGSGRNAIFLASRGHRVVACDASGAAVRAIREAAREHSMRVVQMDLDQPAFRVRAFDNVVCVNFLDRALFPEIARWLRPGGTLLFDTFLVDQREIGHPKNPDFLLGRNELLERLHGYRILRYREGAVGDGESRSYRASVVAVRQA